MAAVALIVTGMASYSSSGGERGRDADRPAISKPFDPFMAWDSPYLS